MVDDSTTFEEKVYTGKKLFSTYNKKTNPYFKVVRANLAEMSGGTVRCNYCEDSNANQVEHIYPKNFYPEKCFVWENYCFACGPCNQPKSDQFAIYQEGTNVEINLKNLPEFSAPPKGNPLLIDPRKEDPMVFLFLDITDTFKFVPYSSRAEEKRRALYTIDVLGLNSRSYLVRARKNAFYGFRARLYEYVKKKEEGLTSDKLQPLVEALIGDHHQTVWQEMIRQRTNDHELNDLFNVAPEALNWGNQN